MRDVRCRSSNRLVLLSIFALLLVLPGCQFMQNEFFYLNRPPPPLPEVGPESLRGW